MAVRAALLALAVLGIAGLLSLLLAIECKFIQNCTGAGGTRPAFVRCDFARLLPSFLGYRSLKDFCGMWMYCIDVLGIFTSIVRIMFCSFVFVHTYFWEVFSLFRKF